MKIEKKFYQKPWFWILIVFLFLILIRIVVIIIEPYSIEVKYKSCIKICESNRSLEQVNKNLKKFDLSMNYQKCMDMCNKRIESDKKYTIRESMRKEIEKGNKSRVVTWIIFGG